jgi:hypothetical protein
MKPFSNSLRASSLAGLALAFLLWSPLPVLAQKIERTRVIDSILGVGIGTTVKQAHAKLDRLRKREASGTREADPREEAEEREGGRKEAWTLKTTDYLSVALQTDREGRVVWITGFVRPEKEIPFAKLGDLSSAMGVTSSRAIWNVATPTGGYRVVAKGQNGKARIISLLSLATPPVQ